MAVAVKIERIIAASRFRRGLARNSSIPFPPPLDLRRAVALVGEGGQHQPADARRLRLREGAARMPPDEVP